MNINNIKWVVVENHPVFKGETLIMSELFDMGKSVKKGKLICRIGDIRGDSFTRLESKEKKAHTKLIVAAPELLNANIIVKHYAEQALKSLDSNSLGQVRGMLEGILEKATDSINQATI